MPIDVLWSFKPPGPPTLVNKIRNSTGQAWSYLLIHDAADVAFQADHVAISHGDYSLDCVLGPNGKRIATLSRKVEP